MAISVIGRCRRTARASRLESENISSALRQKMCVFVSLPGRVLATYAM